MRIKNIITALALIFMGNLALFSASTTAVSCPTGSARSSADTLAECNIEKPDSNSDVMSVVKAGINVVIGLIAVTSVIMIIVGGIQYTTSRGDAAKIKKARDTIIYSVIGLVIALLAFAIVNFVLSGVFNGGKSLL